MTSRDLGPRCEQCNLPMALSPFPEDWVCSHATVCSKCTALDQVDENERSRRLGHLAWCFNIRETKERPGIPMRLHSANSEGIPPEIRNAIPAFIFQSVRMGSLHSLQGRGFGLVGGVGTRKSGTIAYLVASLLTRSILRAVATGNFVECSKPTINAIWCNWPETSDFLQRNAVEVDLINRKVMSLREADILVLDDLGMERMPRTTDGVSTPFAMGQLQLLINYRNANRKPIFWTSNLQEEDLAGLYGMATYSRLIEDNPPIFLRKGATNYRLEHI